MGKYDHLEGQLLETFASLMAVTRKQGVMRPNIQTALFWIYRTLGPEKFADIDEIIEAKNRTLPEGLRPYSEEEPPLSFLENMTQIAKSPKREVVFGDDEPVDWLRFISAELDTSLGDRNSGSGEEDARSNIYQQCRELDTHLFFRRKEVMNPQLLENARQKFLEGDEVACAQYLVDFCRSNPGTVLEKDMFPSVSGQSERVISDITADRHTFEWDDDEKFAPDALDLEARVRFQEGSVNEALFLWSFAYLLDRRRDTSALHALITFYGAVLQDFRPLHELLFRAETTGSPERQNFQTLSDIIALEYTAEGQISDAPSFTSLHNVYDVEAKEGFSTAHLITKISRRGIQERIEAERQNLDALAEKVGALRVFGAEISLPSLIRTAGTYPDFSVILEHFISDAKTVKDILQQPDISEQERLRHTEMMAAYTALFQRKGFCSPSARELVEEDYRRIFSSKMHKLGIDISAKENLPLASLIEQLIAHIVKLPTAFYINSSSTNFLVSDDKSSRKYYKVDFESEECRCYLIDPVTVIFDPLTRIESYQNYLLALHHAVYSGYTEQVPADEKWMQAFFRRKEEGDDTSLEDAYEFEDRYKYLHPEFETSLQDAGAVCAYRDLSIVIDRMLDDQRVKDVVQKKPKTDKWWLQLPPLPDLASEIPISGNLPKMHDARALRLRQGRLESYLLDSRNEEALAIMSRLALI
ncbi:MAG: hypothetical protein KJ574_04915 [Nanoarchaeota archaeon]|nr:hypothetical protein [Nanoarchaeota archaeon]